MIFIKTVSYKHETSLVKDTKPNQEVELVCYNREFVITVIVITEFDCSFKSGQNWLKLIISLHESNFRTHSV